MLMARIEAVAMRRKKFGAEGRQKVIATL